MARSLRIDEEEGLHHVINRGNYRRWIFEEEGAKLAFETTLFEACERAGWLLHGFCIMGNHFHLALETPRANLSEGMRWLQSVFANRFNRFRKEAGHLFQGRFKSLVVEDSQRLGWLCHYIHLNPVRAGICRVKELIGYRWSSFWYLAGKGERPGFLRLETCLREAGGLKDAKTGWAAYGRYLAWLAEDEPAKKQMEFERMSRGWALGTQSFQSELVADRRQLECVVKRNRAEARQARELAWKARLEKCLHLVRKGRADIASEPKAAPWKVAIAAHLKDRLMATNIWLGARLNMGVPFGVSRYVGEMRSGERPEAERIHARLATKIKH